MFFFKDAVLTSSKQNFEMQIVSCVNFGKIDMAKDLVEKLMIDNNYVEGMGRVVNTIEQLLSKFNLVEENKLFLT